jgi:hypothetical protein
MSIAAPSVKTRYYWLAMHTKLPLALTLFFLRLSAQPGPPGEPRFTGDGQLLRPDDYREWIYLSSGLGMIYGPAGSVAAPSSERFDNVFVAPQAYKAFLQTGDSAAKGSINNGGHYQEGFAGLEIHLKDAARFPTKWAFFEFGGSQQASKPFPANSTCQTCHAKNGAVDQTFVQFYPTLIPVAKQKGTFNPSGPASTQREAAPQ